MGSIQNALLLYAAVRWLSGGEALAELASSQASSQAELASLSWNIILLERINDKLLLFRHGYLGDTLLKMIKINLSEEETNGVFCQ